MFMVISLVQGVPKEKREEGLIRLRLSRIRTFPTNNAPLVNFLLSSDAEILLISINRACKLVPNVQKRVCNVYTFQLSFRFACHSWWLGRHLSLYYTATAAQSTSFSFFLRHPVYHINYTRPTTSGLIIGYGRGFPIKAKTNPAHHWSGILLVVKTSRLTESVDHGVPVVLPLGRVHGVLRAHPVQVGRRRRRPNQHVRLMLMLLMLLLLLLLPLVLLGGHGRAQVGGAAGPGEECGDS